MHELILRQLREDTENGPDSHRNAVVNNLDRIRQQRLRIYRTFSRRDRNEKSSEELFSLFDFTFETTNKEAHLFLGMLDPETLRHLGSMLEEAYTRHDISRLLLMKDHRKEKGWLVTRNESKSFEVIFTFSPAR